MTLQTVGSISFGDIRLEFGGPTPMKLSDYYRGGPYVPTYNKDPNSGWYRSTNYQVRFQSGAWSWIWAGQSISNSSNSSVTTGGWTYYKESNAYQSGGDAKAGTYYEYYGIRRQKVNNVPTSGAISLSDFYGAGK